MDELRTLILGIGNPARGDDGLGAAFISALGESLPEGFRAEACYQLAVEDAIALSQVDRVCFVDASVDVPAPFDWQPVGADPQGTMDSHALTPGALLMLTGILFNTIPEAWLLAIRAEETSEIREQLSETATQHLALALRFFKEKAGIYPDL